MARIGGALWHITHHLGSPDDSVLAGAGRTEEEREAFVHRDTRRLNELGGSLHLLVAIRAGPPLKPILRRDPGVDAVG